MRALFGKVLLSIGGILLTLVAGGITVAMLRGRTASPSFQPGKKLPNVGAGVLGLVAIGVVLAFGFGTFFVSATVYLIGLWLEERRAEKSLQTLGKVVMMMALVSLSFWGGKVVWGKVRSMTQRKEEPRNELVVLNLKAGVEHYEPLRAGTRFSLKNVTGDSLTAATSDGRVVITGPNECKDYGTTFGLSMKSKKDGEVQLKYYPMSHVFKTKCG